jgi:hypothetical protein
MMVGAGLDWMAVSRDAVTVERMLAPAIARNDLTEV